MARRSLVSCTLFLGIAACTSGAPSGLGVASTTAGGGGMTTTGLGGASTVGGGMSAGGTTPTGGTTTAGGTTTTGGATTAGGSTSIPGAGAGGGTAAGGFVVGNAGAGAGGVNAGGMDSAGGRADSGGASAGGTASGGVGSGGVPVASGEDIPCDRDFDIPTFEELPDNPKMPDPFTFLDGTKVTSKADFVCRQKEISLLAQAFIYGPKPPPPASLEAEFSSGTLTINMENEGRTWELSVSIDTPSGDGPFPAVFDVDGSGAPSGLASIDTSLGWLTSNVAAAGQGRGTSGEFYDFHPDSTATGSLMAWAWAASRIVDALEITEGHNIDPTKLYGLGCSRNGKAAATMALFDRRMAMVAMYSPGSGSTSGWRPAEASTGNVQTAGQIYGETTWMGEDFGQFGSAVDKLPVDQHEVLALGWPRPVIVREGTNDSWNCPSCVYTTVKYTQLTYEALGAKDAVGFTHYNGGHCESGGQEWSTLHDAFVQKYLFDDTSVSTEGMFTESFEFDAEQWQDGELPTLP